METSGYGLLLYIVSGYEIENIEKRMYVDATECMEYRAMMIEARSLLTHTAIVGGG